MRLTRRLSVGGGKLHVVAHVRRIHHESARHTIVVGVEANRDFSKFKLELDEAVWNTIVIPDNHVCQKPLKAKYYF